MNISNIKVITGPNYWSIDHNRLIVVCFNGESSNIDPEVWNQRLHDLFPSAGETGFTGKGTYTGIHAIGDLAIRLQATTGFASRFHQVIPDTLGCEQQLVFEYEEAGCGKRAAEKAFEIFQMLQNNQQVEIITHTTEL